MEIKEIQPKVNAKKGSPCSSYCTSNVVLHHTCEKPSDYNAECEESTSLLVCDNPSALKHS
jgi:hypothetical protein